MTTEWEKLYATALAVAVPKVISEQMCSGGVGAAVLTDKGNVYTGVCIDTDCSLGMCAERKEVSQMISYGAYGARNVSTEKKEGEKRKEERGEMRAEDRDEEKEKNIIMAKIGFDLEKYLRLQSERILERVHTFGGKLYLEFGGKLFDDYHASRVLPGFLPDSKLQMLLQMKEQVEMVIAINAADIEKNKIRGDLGITYDRDVLRLIDIFRRSEEHTS